jgi:hypothetical protein
MTTTTFTIEDALAIQAEQINQWAKVLNYDAYLMLIDEVNERNAQGHKSPYDVFRGNSIDEFIKNVCMNNL